MRSVFAFAFALAASTLMACAGSKSVTEPSPGGPPPPSVVLPPVFAFPGKGPVPVGAVFNEGDEVEITVQTLGNGGTLAIAFVLSRDGDGETAAVLCHDSRASSSTGSTRRKFEGMFYAWAKGHVLNGVILQADLGDIDSFEISKRYMGCYFWDYPGNGASGYYAPVNFDRADKRTDYDLNWRVN